MRKIIFIGTIIAILNCISVDLNAYAPHGGSFTPKGDLKVLLVTVRFGATVDSTIKIDSVWHWNSPYPNEILENKVFYTDYSLFNTPINHARDINNISRWYYEMSGATFRLIVDTVSVIIDEAPPQTNAESLRNFNPIVIDTLTKWDSTSHPFNWSNYDNRCHPNFMQDCSQNGNPDSKVDYVVIMYRWAPKPNPWDVTVSGEAGIGNHKRGNYTIDQGFTQFRGNKSIFGLFIHEVAHTLYNCPHYGFANSVVGSKFYGQIGGWGAMKLADYQIINTPFRTDNAWERWFLGWTDTNGIEISASGKNADIPLSRTIPPQGDTFVLRDYATTGDAVRIEIPVYFDYTELSFSRPPENTKQRLWLENRQGKSLYDIGVRDSIPITTISGTDTVPVHQPSKGIYAYIEDIAGSRNETAANGANGIKYLHSQGNYDFTVNGLYGYYWDNPVYKFVTGAANPYSGQSKWENIRYNFDGNDAIRFHMDADDGNKYGGNEHEPILMLDGQLSLDYCGINAAFRPGRKLGIATNPPLTNNPGFNFFGDEFGFAICPLILNGIEVEMVNEASNGNITVVVRRNKVDIDNNFRMAARRIELMDITGSVVRGNLISNPGNDYDTLPDLRVMPYRTLTINRSGSVTRATKRGDRFNDPTTFTCHTGSIFRVQPNGRVELRDSTTLALRAGSKLIVDSLGVVWVSCCSKIVSADNNNIELLGNFNNRGKIIFANCGGFVDTTFYTASICKKADDDFYLSLKVSKFHFDSHFPSHFFIEFDSTYSLRNLIDISSLYTYSGMDSVDVSVLLTNYFYSLHGADFDIDTIGKVYFYFLHFDGSLHRWTININPSVAFKLEERLNKEGIKNFVSGKTVSLYFPNDEQRTISLPIDIEGCETEYQDSVFLSKGFCEREFPPIHFNCDDCEGGDFIFKIYGYSLPDITVNRNCSGGALLEAFGGINCGGLSFRWVRVDDDGNSEKMETGKNLDNVVVSKTGKYRIEYFHPDDPSKVIYYSRSEEVEQEHLGEQILTDRGTMVYPSYHLTSDNSMYLCAFVPFFNVHKDYIDYKFTLYMRGEKNSFWGSPEPLVVHSAVHDKETPHYIYLFRLLECELREYKIVIRDPNTDRVVCELIIPVDCECYTCDGLAKQFTVKKGEFYKVIHNLQFQYTAGSCVYKIKIPAGVDVDSIKRNGASLSLASYLDTVDGNIYFNYTTNRPCDIIPDSLIRDTFEIFYYDFEGNPCSIKRVFECRCEGIRNRYMLTVHPKVYPLEYILTYCKGSLSPPIPPEDEDLDFWLYDNFGNRIQLLRTLQAGSIPCGDFDFNMPNNYPNGIYHITLENNKGQMLGNEKFVFVK